MKNITLAHYEKVGRIKMNVARKAHIKSADILISENQIRHIENKHSSELAILGISAISFVRLVCNNFNQIRKGRDESILLVIYDIDLSFVIAIDLNYSIQKNFWEVKTAEPRRLSSIKKSVLIWAAAKHTASGNGNRPN